MVTVLVAGSSPAAAPTASTYEQTGVSILRYAGDGRFDFEEDLLNMTHVLEDLATSGWRPGPGFQSPPAHPDRNAAQPSGVGSRRSALRARPAARRRSWRRGRAGPRRAGRA